MRCPYCGGNNADRAVYCTYCGRDLKPPAQTVAGQQSPSYQQPRPTPGQQGRPLPPQSPRTAPGQQGRPAYPPQGQPAAAPVPQAQPQRRPAPVPPPPPPEPPAPFPPQTVAELQELEQEALPYTVVESSVGDGRKKVVRIAYAKGVAWQQVATLLKACKEQQEAQFETILIQGVLERDTSVYNFTNGQLRFDRNVRLGGMISDRYQIETGNGFETDSVRIVLNSQ